MPMPGMEMFARQQQQYTEREEGVEGEITHVSVGEKESNVCMTSRLSITDTAGKELGVRSCKILTLIQ